MTSACQKWLIPISASRQIGVRPSRLSQIKNTVAQKLPEPSGNNAYRRKPAKPMIKLSAQAGRTHPARPDIKPPRPSNPHKHH